MQFGSVCSGIEAASVAFQPLGWRAAWFSEIEPFPCAVLAHHHPDVPNLGDMTTIRGRLKAGEIDAPDILCGGTPCQSFSVAGLRKSLSDDRGNLSLEFIRIANAIDHLRRAAGRGPAWILWENVPGVLSTADNAFGAFLGGLGGCESALDEPADGWPGAGVVAGPQRVVAWRTLDAQHFGVAQRRRRVFVLALAGPGGWACADALLPVGDRLLWHPAPSREAGQAAPTIPARSTGGGGLGTDFDCDGGLIAQPHASISPAIKARDFKGVSSDGDGDGAIIVPMVSHSLRGEGFDASEDGTGRGTPLVPVAFHNRQDPDVSGDITHPLGAQDNGMAVLIDTQQITSAANRTRAETGMPASTLAARSRMHVAQKPNFWQVRRLTPTECERLQGFPDGYTAISWRGKAASQCPDGPRYKALGNSWAVPVVRWIGEQINNQLTRTT